ncbi:MAG: pyridoxamine 5'-phosphate oxidase family protein [Paracoccus sp. (in: a-proteobacteria)]|nr:pyridoxamine 5'-phosphate oxidase family protein [Paracoccus sp. (in: a-proteobacteria)]
MTSHTTTHGGEEEMRAMLPSRYHWNEDSLAAMMRPELSPAMARFIAAQPFFFIATADAGGACDASFRGRDYDASGPLPALIVNDPRHIIFPDFEGNGLYNSLGNLRVNPQIGMLFIDFERQRRVRVNGTAGLRRPTPLDATIWPAAQAVIEVTVAQAYGNCSARIPRLRMVPDSDAPFS